MDEPVPSAARVEIVERHDGEKYDAAMPIRPNLVRVNGIPLWCSASKGITVEIDGCHPAPLVVTLRLQARALSIGTDPSGAVPAPPAPPGERPHFARIEVPGLADDAKPGDVVATRWVVIDGHRLLTSGPVKVSAVIPDDDIVEVAVPLVCRTVVFDDEPAELRTGD